VAKDTLGYERKKKASSGLPAGAFLLLAWAAFASPVAGIVMGVMAMGLMLREAWIAGTVMAVTALCLLVAGIPMGMAFLVAYEERREPKYEGGVGER
jgi:uncharacterized membrane protein YoaK (UPF0700 family)